MSIDLSLDRIQAVLSRLPLYTCPTIHIAGTNGKGSVSALLTSILLASSSSDTDLNTKQRQTFNVGRFNSPHLLAVHDSITLNDYPVPSHFYASAASEVRALDAAHSIGASSFELLTATALLIFTRLKCDVVICEVGMGGRLDATNAIPDAAIVVSVITSVDLDHQAFLGGTVKEIASEKAGITRRGGLVVLGPQGHPEVVEAARRVASEKGATLIDASPVTVREWDEQTDGPHPPPFSLRPFRPPPLRPVSVDDPDGRASFGLLLPLQGDHQRENLGTALAVIDALRLRLPEQGTPLCSHVSRLTDSAIRKAVTSCSWRGRLSFHSYTPRSSTRIVPLLVDGAHNPAAAGFLASYLVDLLSSLAPSASTASQPEQAHKNLTLTYIMGLSYSPPKTPESVISPLLDAIRSLRISLDVRVRIALPRFTRPEGMPWVKPVSPRELKQVVASLIPDAEIWLPHGTDNAGIIGSSEASQALEWAAELENDDDHLVLVAGSLYLVADVYRIFEDNAAAKMSR